VCFCDLALNTKKKKSTNIQVYYSSEGNFSTPVFSIQKYFGFVMHFIHWAELRYMIWQPLVTAAYPLG